MKVTYLSLLCNSKIKTAAALPIVVTLRFLMTPIVPHILHLGHVLVKFCPPPCQRDQRDYRLCPRKLWRRNARLLRKVLVLRQPQKSPYTHSTVARPRLLPQHKIWLILHVHISRNILESAVMERLIPAAAHYGRTVSIRCAPEFPKLLNAACLKAASSSALPLFTRLPTSSHRTLS